MLYESTMPSCISCVLRIIHKTSDVEEETADCLTAVSEKTLSELNVVLDNVSHSPHDAVVKYGHMFSA